MRDADATDLLAPLLEEAKYSTWHLVGPDGRLLDRAAAETGLLTYLGAGPVAVLAARMEGATAVVYELIARHRSGLGRFVPDGPGPRRYP